MESNRTELIKALVRVQATVGTARRDASNSAFRSKYATLDSVYDACREALAGNGLCITQRISYEHRDGQSMPVMYLQTTIMHESGETMDGGSYPIIVPDIAQGPRARQDHHAIGSAITYARRYSLMSLLGIATEDDDGNMASRGTPRPQPQPRPQPPRDTHEVDARKVAAAWAVNRGTFKTMTDALAEIDRIKSGKDMTPEEFREAWKIRCNGASTMDRVAEQLEQ